MNFSRVKTILIVCLMVANIIIGSLCGSIYIGKYYVSEKEASFAQNHLKKNGISVSFAKEDLKKQSLPVYITGAQSTEGAPELFTVLSEAFFGRRIHDTEYVDIPGGYSVSIKNNDGDAVGTSFIKNKNYIECFLEEYSEETVTKTVAENFFFIDSSFGGDKNNQISAEKFVSNTFKKTAFDLRALGSREFGKGTIVYFSVFLSDKAVLDFYLNMYVVDEKIVSLCANLPMSGIEKAYSTNMLDVVDAVYSFSELFCNATETTDEDKGSNVEILGTQLLYKVISNSVGDYYLIPTWKIEYTENFGKREIALFDAISGKNKYNF